MATAKERHPEVYVERNEDTRKRRRTVPMEVFSFGASRTGTMAMKAAFEVLGFPTWHWVTMAENPPDLAMWTQALQAKWEPERGVKPFGRAEFDNLLGHWSATTDQPASYLAEDLIDAYPDTKVVLVERDIESWYKSYSKTVINGTASPFIPLASMIDKTFLGQFAAQSDLMVRHLFDVREPRTQYALLNNPDYFEQWRSRAKNCYREHNEKVKRITPKERLLVFKLEDGWKPLCDFLGKPIPDVAFPRVNETEAVQEKINLYIAESYKRSAIKFARRTAPVLVLLLAVALAWRAL